MHHRPILGRKVRKGGTKAVIIGQKEPGVAMVGDGMAQEGVRGKSGPRVTFVLCQAQHRRRHVRGAPFRDVGNPVLCKARGPPLRQDGGSSKRVETRGGERGRRPIRPGGACRTWWAPMRSGGGRRGRKTGSPRRSRGGGRLSGQRARGMGAAYRRGATKAGSWWGGRSGRRVGIERQHSPSWRRAAGWGRPYGTDSGPARRAHRARGDIQWSGGQWGGRRNISHRGRANRAQRRAMGSGATPQRGWWKDGG